MFRVEAEEGRKGGFGFKEMDWEGGCWGDERVGSVGREMDGGFLAGGRRTEGLGESDGEFAGGRGSCEAGHGG